MWSSRIAKQEIKLTSRLGCIETSAWEIPTGWNSPRLTARRFENQLPISVSAWLRRRLNCTDMPALAFHACASIWTRIHDLIRNRSYLSLCWLIPCIVAKPVLFCLWIIPQRQMLLCTDVNKCSSFFLWVYSYAVCMFSDSQSSVGIFAV